MAASTKIDAIDWLRKQLEEAPDALRRSLGRMVQMILHADVDEACTAGWGQHTDDRTNYPTTATATATGHVAEAISRRFLRNHASRIERLLSW